MQMNIRKIIYMNCGERYVFISFLAVQIYDRFIHLHSSSSTGILRTHNVTSLRWLDSSVGRALHRYRRGHGFEIPFRPEFFSGFHFTSALIVCTTAMINHAFTHYFPIKRTYRSRNIPDTIIIRIQKSFRNRGGLKYRKNAYY